MNQLLDVRELAIAIATQNHNPAILTLDFLRYSGIIPADGSSDWELVRSPITTNRLSQLSFQNGVTLIAQPDKLIFLEAIAGKSPESVKAADIARRYLTTLPNAEYRAIGINLQGHVLFPDDPALAHRYLTEGLMRSGPWQTFGQAPVHLGLQFVYTLDRCQLNLAINEAKFQLPEQLPIPVILFAANFNYDLEQQDPQEQRSRMISVIENWQSDLATYRELITTRFLDAALLQSLSQRNHLTLPVGAY